MFSTKNKKGFTLIEIVFLIAIIAILIAIAIPSYVYVKNKAKYEADSASVAILNNSTAAYAAMNGIETNEVYSGILDDDDKIAFLLEQKYLSNEVVPIQEDAEFVWNSDSSKWILVGGLDIEEDEEPEEDEDIEYPVWEAKIKYDKDTYLMHDGKLYYNRSKTKKEPGTHKVWQEVSDYWVKLNIYKKGDTIIHDNKTYIATKNSSRRNPDDNPKHWVLAE